MSLRDQILATKDIPSEVINVPEWDVDIEVRGMTGADRTRILESAVDPKTGAVNLKVVYPEIVIASAHDPKTGERIFTDDDREVVLTKSANALDRVAEVGMRLGGFSKEDSDATAKSFPDGESA